MGIVITEDIQYGSESDRQKVDIYQPEGPRGPLPVVVWIHGGGWSSEELDKHYMPKAQLEQLATMGFLIASIEYRLCQHALFPAQISDCKCAIRFLRANAEKYNLDPNKIGVWGESAGGHLASLLGAAGDVSEFEGCGGFPEYSSKVQAVCSWYAPYDKAAQQSPGTDSEDSIRFLPGSLAAL